MHPADIVGGKTGCHGLHAFAFSRQKQTEAIAYKRLLPVLVSCRLRQTLKVGGKTLFTWA